MGQEVPGRTSIPCLFPLYLPHLMSAMFSLVTRLASLLRACSFLPSRSGGLYMILNLDKAKECGVVKEGRDGTFGHVSTRFGPELGHQT